MRQPWHHRTNHPPLSSKPALAHRRILPESTIRYSNSMTHLPLLASGRPLAIAVAIILFASAAHAQLKHEGPASLIALSQTTAPYDVVSIRQNNSGAGAGVVLSDRNDVVRRRGLREGDEAGGAFVLELCMGGGREED